tara:strand:+ start:48478 stop:49083 length:606 start_codon:yes stop_codon:yes gene_type:complete
MLGPLFLTIKKYKLKIKLMKKLFLLTVVAVLGLSTVTAQEVKFGAKAGVNFANVSGDDIEGVDGRTSINIGAVVNIGISEKFAVQPELVYSAQGITSGDLTAKLDYINLPILADFTVAQGFSLQAGPQIGFNINDKIDGDGEGDGGSFDAESIDFGAALGAQYAMETGLFFQARYSLGLSEVVKDVDAKNSVFSISVGYFF